MQIGNRMYMATDWASMHREKMSRAELSAADTDTQDREEVSFGETFNFVRGNRLDARVSGERKAPYSYLADDGGAITYNGVTFFCDYEKNRICLGDVSDIKDCICVGLSEGGSLVVNRDNIGNLSKAIGMFSPEDANRIMRAISQDAMCQRKLQEIDETKNSIGEAEDAENSRDTENDRKI